MWISLGHDLRTTDHDHDKSESLIFSHGPWSWPLIWERGGAQMRRRHVEDAWEGGLSWSRKHFEVGERLMRWQRNFLSCSGFSFDEFAWTSRVFRLGFGNFSSRCGLGWIRIGASTPHLKKLFVHKLGWFRRFATSLGVEFGGWSSSIGWCTRICGLEFDILGFENFFSGYGRNLRFLSPSLFLKRERERRSICGVYENFVQSDFRVMVFSLDSVLVFRKVSEISGFGFKFSTCSILATSTDFAEFAFVGFKISWNLKKFSCMGSTQCLNFLRISSSFRLSVQNCTENRFGGMRIREWV